MVTAASILVTGGSGFIGRHLVARLLRENRAVRVLSRSSPPGIQGSGLEWHAGDIRIRSQVHAAMRGVETVYHAAALVPGRTRDGDFRETNVEGTRNVVDTSLRNGAGRLVFVSSVAAYAKSSSPVVGESAPVGGTDAYGSSKCAAEEVVREACAGRIPHAIVRPCQIYGPGDSTGYTGRLLALARMPVLPVPAGPGAAFSLMHVEDLIEALLLAANHAAPGGETYNVSGAAPTTLEEIARAAMAACHGRQVRVRVPRWCIRALCGRGSILPGGPEYDTGKARKELGYRPVVSIQEGICSLVRN